MIRCLPVVLVVVVLFSGCGRKKKTKSEGKTVFRYNEASGITSLDPAFAKGQADIWGCNQLYNGLVQMNDALEVIPCIAASWEISEDGTLYTFHLRNDVYFHDDAAFKDGKGRKVKSSDFVFSFDRILDSRISSPGAWVFNNVAMDSKTGNPLFTAPDDSTLQIELKEAFPPFLGILTSLYCSVVPYDIIKAYGGDFRKHPVGTGPFKFKLWEDRTNLIFLKNENYFEFENGQRLPYFDAVSISFINDRQAAFLEFVKGNLDFLSGIDASYKDELLTRTGNLREKYRTRFKMETCQYLNTEYMGFLVDSTLSDFESNPVMDVRIRKAINYGFDRNKMMTYLRNGIGTPGVYGMVPPGLPSFDSISVQGYKYDPAMTAKLLSEAGYPGGKGLPEIVMSTTREYQDLCEFMQGQLAESGIRIKLEVNQGAAHREMVAKQKLAFFRASWIADYPEAENYLSLFYSPNFAPVGPNYTHYKSKAFDNYYRTASATVTDSLRYSLYREMDRLIIEDAPVVILYYDQVVRLIQNDVQGLGKNAMNLLSIKKAKKSAK
jgi:oligopeptide transport system substrate-binding protein